MYHPIPTDVEQVTAPLPFEDKKVDNEGFFQAIADGLPSILSDTEIHKRARIELQTLFTDMKKQKFIRGVTEWTASEQKNFFEKVQSEVASVGALASTQIREKIQALIEDETWREINDTGVKYILQDGDGNTMIDDMNEYQQFLDNSFIANKETSVIPLDLRLTISETETVADAKKKLERYDGKYNALVLVDVNDHPIGIVKQEALQKYEDVGGMTLQNIDHIEGLFGYYNTTSTEAKELMQGNDVNILPIIDSNTGILIGILTGAIVARKDLQYYSTTSLTKLSLDCLGTHV